MTIKSKLSWFAAALALASVASACESESVDIGNTAVLGASLSDYEGTWVGYAELAEWDDGTQTVRLVLDENGDGVIEFGEADPLSPPVADEGYPRGQESIHGFGGPAILGVVSGFSYPVEGAIVESKRIRMGSSSQELYRQWCSLMTPHRSSDVEGADVYSCLPNVGFVSDEDGCHLGDEDMTQIDCGLLSCMHVCQCQESGCGANTEGDDIRMDAALESNGTELEGSFQVPQGSYFVRMTRQ